jgi:hypothetical protein
LRQAFSIIGFVVPTNNGPLLSLDAVNRRQDRTPRGYRIFFGEELLAPV